MTRRQFLRAVGATAGAAGMYQAMAGLGIAHASTWTQRPDWRGGHGDVLILGTGLAGLTAAFELQQAGYRVSLLEYGSKVGGRTLTLRRGDVVSERQAPPQVCQFDEGQYFNAGAMRVPYHHHALLDYCRRFGVVLEPFVQANYNAWLASESAPGGRERFRTVRADFQGGISELLTKVAESGHLDKLIDSHDLEALLESLQIYGALDADGRYTKNRLTSDRRGYDRWPGGGLHGAPAYSSPSSLKSVLNAQLWRQLGTGERVDYHPAMMQIAGGADRLAHAFAERLAPGSLRFGAQVMTIEQDHRRVRVRWRDTLSGHIGDSEASRCICTLPLPVLRQLDIRVDASMRQAINAVDYAASCKIGLQFKRRFWEEDDRMYGGITYTDSAYGSIAYPSHGFGSAKGVMLGSYTSRAQAETLGALPPSQRIASAARYATQLHDQGLDSFEHGVTVAWQNMPGAQGCWASWTDDLRDRHYRTMSNFSGRIGLAGEHVSYLAGWQEGAITSALDMAGQLHARAMAGLAAG